MTSPAKPAARRRVATPTKVHGGKHYLAPRIVTLMHPHRRYIEAYAGGLSVLLAKDPEGVSEVVNDVNKGVTNFWNVLKHEHTFAAFRRVVEATPFSEAEWRTAVGLRALGWAGVPTEGDIPPSSTAACVLRAAAFFVACRQSLAGRIADPVFAPTSRARTRRGMNEQASAWLSAVDGLPAVHARLKRVYVYSRAALDVIRREDGADALFYLDPPYLPDTRATTGEYEFEMTEADHDRLLDLLRGVKGQFLLSGYRSPLYDAVAANCGWWRHEFVLANHASGARTKGRKVECVWANRPPPAGVATGVRCG